MAEKKKKIKGRHFPHIGPMKCRMLTSMLAQQGWPLRGCKPDNPSSVPGSHSGRKEETKAESCPPTSADTW